MTNTISLEVFHLDDQPELVAWIPRALSMWFWKNFRDDMQGMPDDEDDEEAWTFSIFLRAGGEVFDTRYRIFDEPDKLIVSLLQTDPNHVVLVLLDQTVGHNNSAGCETYCRIGRDKPEVLQRTFMLTAYPNTVLSELKWPVDTDLLIAKPAAPDLVIGHFVNRLIDVRRPSPGTREKFRNLINR